jgi:hypothetical protein
MGILKQGRRYVHDQPKLASWSSCFFKESFSLFFIVILIPCFLE